MKNLYFAKAKKNDKGQNKLEASYDNYLNLLLKSGNIKHYEFEPFNLRIGKKCFYKIDFLVINKDDIIELHEVKGHWMDDAKVKMRAVAHNYYFFKFIGVQKKLKEWVFTEYN